MLLVPSIIPFHRLAWCNKSRPGGVVAIEPGPGGPDITTSKSLTTSSSMVTLRISSCLHLQPIWHWLQQKHE